ncbi:hypothetical protein SCOR_18260 [Sulfidibacter corallicola]
MQTGPSLLGMSEAMWNWLARFGKNRKKPRFVPPTPAQPFRTSAIRSMWASSRKGFIGRLKMRREADSETG